MNIVLKTFTGMALCAVGVFGLGSILLIAYLQHSELVTKSYSTLATAQEDIQKGWIPPILPPSSYAIHDSHDLDVNSGAGSFSFDPKDKDFFIRSSVISIPETDKSDDLKKLEKEGYKLGIYAEDSKAKWILAVHDSGKGYYWLEYAHK